MSFTRRALCLGALFAPLAAEAADDPGSVVREALRRAVRGQSLADMLAAPDAATMFTRDLLAQAQGSAADVALEDFHPFSGPPDQPGPPRLLALRILKRQRDLAFVEATLRARGRRRRPWTTYFTLRRDGRLWRIDDLRIDDQPGALRARLQAPT